MALGTAPAAGKARRGTYTIARAAPTCVPRRPARRARGEERRDSRKASFRLAGSPSAPLATTTGRRRGPDATARPLGRHREPSAAVPDQPAGLELARQPGWALDEVTPAAEVGPELRLRTARRSPCSSRLPGRGAIGVPGRSRHAHCARAPETWPVSVPAPGSSERLMVSPMIRPGLARRADGRPVEGRDLPVMGPKVTSLRRITTPPFTVGPLMRTCERRRCVGQLTG